jgi:hypothetical protein
MAKEQPTPTEQDDKQFMFDVNAAVQQTEMEIFDEAMDAEPDENDGDTSLEEMGEDVDGEDLDEEDEAQDTEQDTEEPPRDSEEEDEELDEEQEEPPEEAPEQAPEEAAQERPQRGIPSSRLREEADARRRFEQENTELRRQLAEINGRMTEMSARMNAPPPPRPEAPPPKPDMFADPEGYERWIRAEALRDSRNEMALMREQMRQEMQQRDLYYAQQRANMSFEAAEKRDPDKFDRAYGRLTVLRASNMQATEPIIQQLMQSADPGAELLRWWDSTDAGQDYSARVRRYNGGQQRPRHETHLPETMRRNYPPSLNAQGGSSRQRVTDPEAYDDTDDSVFRFATKR